MDPMENAMVLEESPMEEVMVPEEHLVMLEKDPMMPMESHYCSREASDWAYCGYYGCKGPYIGSKHVALLLSLKCVVLGMVASKEKDRHQTKTYIT